jgi:hypothetical protein
VAVVATGQPGRPGTIRPVGVGDAVGSGAGGMPAAAGEGVPGGKAGAGPGIFTPSFSNEIVMTVPELFTVTLPAPTSICTTSISPSRWPSVKIMESSFSPWCPGPDKGSTFSSARLYPLRVVMPVSKILRSGFCGAGSTAGCSRGFKPKALRSGIARYRSTEVSRETAAAQNASAAHARTPSPHLSVFHISLNILA